jgi:uncharacterized membrane protein
MAQPTEGQGEPDDSTGSASPVGVGERLRQVFVSGIAIMIPIIVTVIVLVFVVNFMRGLVSPAVSVLTDTAGVGQSTPDYVLELAALVSVVVLIFVVGLLAEARPGGGIEDAFDSGVARLPGIGSVYTSFNEMSELLLSSDSQSFREVKLVEFPTLGSYTVAFVTADAPRAIEEATGNDGMTTLFMPMAPNPVMGGFVLHVSEERVYDVDISVEEGIQSIVTSGVTVGADEEIGAGEIGEISGVEPVESTEELEAAIAEARHDDTETADDKGPGDDNVDAGTRQDDTGSTDDGTTTDR